MKHSPTPAAATVHAVVCDNMTSHLNSTNSRCKYQINTKSNFYYAIISRMFIYNDKHAIETLAVCIDHFQRIYVLVMTQYRDFNFDTISMRYLQNIAISIRYDIDIL